MRLSVDVEINPINNVPNCDFETRPIIEHYQRV